MDKTTPDTPSGDAPAEAPDTQDLAGGPPAAPTTAGAPAEPAPTGSAEPAKQAVSGTANPPKATPATASAITPDADKPAPGRVVTPRPSDYEMPDEYASESPIEKARLWAEAHPGLALLAAGVGGLVIGRILVGLAPDPEPETLSTRVEKRAKQLKKQAKGSFEEAKDSAGEAATATSAALAAAAIALKEAAERAAEKAGDWAEDVPDKARHFAEDAEDMAKEGVEKAKDLGDTLSDLVKVAVTGIVAKKAGDWVSKFRS